MALMHPTRRAFVTGAPLALAAATARAGPLLQPQRLAFMVIGDWGRDGGAYQCDVAAAMRAVQQQHGSEFVVTTGDNFYWSGVNSLADPQWDSSFERIYAEELGVWHAVLGNHDYGGKVDAQIARTFRSGSRWHMPDRCFERLIQRPGLPDIHLFFIDTVAWLGKESFPFGLIGSPTGRAAQEAHLAKLSGMLEASAAPIKLVIGHYGIYSIGTHGGRMRMANLDELLRQHRVTAYVSGHDHCLYHISHAGLHYVCSGAGSEMLPAYSGGSAAGCVLPSTCASGATAPGSPLWHSFLARSRHPQIDLKGGFALFTLTAQDLSFAFYDSHGKLRHSAMLARFNPVGAL